jgi:hypothetical protein
MRTALNPVSFLVTCIAGWMNQHQHDIIIYLIEENRVLRQQIGNRRLRFNDDQRRRLAVEAKKLSRNIPAQVETIVTPETLLAWHRKLIAKKYEAARNALPDGQEPPLKLRSAQAPALPYICGDHAPIHGLLRHNFCPARATETRMRSGAQTSSLGRFQCLSPSTVFTGNWRSVPETIVESDERYAFAETS